MPASGCSEVGLGELGLARLPRVPEALEGFRVVPPLEEVVALPLPLGGARSAPPEAGEPGSLAAADDEAGDRLDVPDLGGLGAVVDEEGGARPGDRDVEEGEIVPHLGRVLGRVDLGPPDFPPEPGRVGVGGELP